MSDSILDTVADKANELLEEMVVAAKAGQHTHANELLGAVGGLTCLAQKIEDHHGMNPIAGNLFDVSFTVDTPADAA